MDARDALALAAGARAELFALLRELIEAPSPYGHSAKEAQARLGGYLEQNGFAVETTEESWEAVREHPEFSPPPPAAEAPVNLVGRPPESSGLTFFAHVDTEPATGDWTSPPGEAAVLGNRVQGLGAADDKGGLAAAAVAAVLLHRHVGKAPRVASVHGKGGGARGTLPVFAGMAPADCIYVHPPENGAGLGVIKSASRGVLDVTLRVTGWSGRPREIGTPESAPFAEGGDALAACLRLVERLRSDELADCEVNLGRVDAGEAPGRTPVRCEAQIRVLFRGSRTVDGVLDAFRRATAAEAGDAPGSGRSLGFEVTAPGLRANPAETAWDDPLTAGLRSAVAGVTGREPVPYADHLASDIRFPIRLQGAASLGIGSLGGNFYGPDEWVDLDDLVRLVAVLVLVGAPARSAGLRPASRPQAAKLPDLVSLDGAAPNGDGATLYRRLGDAAPCRWAAAPSWKVSEGSFTSLRSAMPAGGRRSWPRNSQT